MIRRPEHVRALRSLLRQFPVVGLLGARQVGKTTLAGMVAAAAGGKRTRFDLEDAATVRRLEDPGAALGPLRGTVILDEIQRVPDLFPQLRVLADRPRRPASFLILGSASPGLLRQSSESLAGRIAYHELGGFSPAETGQRAWPRLWARGGFPPSFAAVSDAASLRWRREFIRTFLERDLPGLGLTIPAATIGRFWSMLAHYHGQIWNGSEFSRSFGMTDMTVRRYLDLLVSTFMIRVLTPWHANLGKRQVKAPKIYFRDAGMLHALLGIEDREALLRHPRMGASWEGFALQEIVGKLGVRWEDCHFWATHGGAELDLFMTRGRERLGFEFKYTSSPGSTPSMHSAMRDLKLDRLLVVHPGQQRYPLGKRMEAVPLALALSGRLF